MIPSLPAPVHRAATIAFASSSEDQIVENDTLAIVYSRVALMYTHRPNIMLIIILIGTLSFINYAVKGRVELEARSQVRQSIRGGS